MNDQTLDILFETRLISNRYQEKVTPDFMIRVMTNFCNALGIDINLVNQNLLEIPQPDLLSQEDLKLIFLYCATYTIFSQILMEDFTISDIIKPGVRRSQNQLKKMSNFVLYYNKYVSDEIERQNLELDEKYKMKQAMIQRKEELRELIAQKSQQIGAIKSQNTKLRLQRDEYKSEVNNLLDQASGNNAKVKNAKLKQLEVMEKLRVLKVEQRNAAKETSAMELHIVKSPDKYNSKLKELQEHKEEIQQGKEALTESSQQLQDTYELKEQLLEYIDQIYQTGDPFCKMTESIQDGTKVKKQLEKKMEQLKQVAKQMQEEEEKANQKKQKVIENIECQKGKSDEELLAMRQNYEKLSQETKMKQKSSHEKNEKLDELRGVKESISTEIERMKAERENMIRDKQAEYERKIRQWGMKDRKINEFLAKFK